MSKKEQVQVQMYDSTQQKIESLKSTLHVQTRSDVVKMSVDIAKMVADILAKNGDVILRDSNGKEVKMVVPGIGE